MSRHSLGGKLIKLDYRTPDLHESDRLLHLLLDQLHHDDFLEAFRGLRGHQALWGGKAGTWGRLGKVMVEDSTVPRLEFKL